MKNKLALQLAPAYYEATKAVEDIANKAAALGVSRQQLYQADHELRGLCTQCSEPVVPGKKMCKLHLLDSRKRSIANNRRRKAKNLCYRCGKPRGNSKRIVCDRCYPIIRQQNAEGKKKHIAKLLAENRCFRCGKPRGDSPTLNCEKCRQIANRRALLRKQRMRE